VRGDGKEYRHEDGNRREEGGKFGKRSVKFENLKGGKVNGAEK
jgi:hypothetical protein